MATSLMALGLISLRASCMSLTLTLTPPPSTPSHSSRGSRTRVLCSALCWAKGSKIIALVAYTRVLDINPWYDHDKRLNLSGKTLIEVFHVNELITSYRKMLELLELDLLNRSYG